MSHSHVGEQRIGLADALVDQGGTPKDIVTSENIRVTQLLAENYTNPYEGWSKIREYGHRVLAKAGVLEPKHPQLVERPWLADAQANRTEHIKSQLDKSRQQLRAGTVFGVDDLEVDAYIGLRDKKGDSILPPLFRRVHGEAEESLGRQVSFLEWMADHATDEQLLNVWQWHDSYLQQLDNEPGFQEMVGRVKRDYARGSQEAVKANRLHSSMRVSSGDLDTVEIVHASPFTAYTATTLARADRKANRITLGRKTDDQHLFHELTHLRQGGLITTLDEGSNELITAEIYDQAYPKKAKYDLEGSVYADQIALHGALERLTEGDLDRYELSRICAGTDRAVNTARLALTVDRHLGMPVFSYALRAANDLQNAAVSKFVETDARYAVSNLLRKQVSVLETVYFDEHGERLRHDAGSLLQRLFSAEMLQKYDENTIVDVAGLVATAAKDLDKLAAKR